MPDKTIKVPSSLTRAAAMTGTVDADARTVRMSISSDTPYKRYDWWDDEEYWEVLDHSPGGIEDERLKAGLPILFNHSRDKHLGRGQSFECDGHKCDVLVKFSESEFAEEKWKDVKSGILVDTSVGYELVGDGICIGAKDELPIYKFRFKVYEASLVTIPADASVGVGRQRDKAPEDKPREILIKGIDSTNNSEQTQTQTKAPASNSPMKTSPLVRSHFLEGDKGGGGGGEGEIKLDAKAIAKAALAEHKAKCEKIKAFVKAVKNDKWRDAAHKIAEKHMEMDEPNFEDFRTEANNSFTSESMIDTPDEGSGVQVIGERAQDPQRGMSAGQRFINAKQIKQLEGRALPKGASVSVNLPDVALLGSRARAMQRAGFTSSDLSAVNLTVNTSILALGTQRLTIMDVIGAGTIGTGAYKYARENGFGSINGVAVAAGAMPRAQAVGERGVKPNWDADLSTETATVSKVAITTKVPDEFLADFPSAMSYIDGRLPFMVDTETEFEILYGDGLNNNLKGIFNTGGVQTRAITATTDTTVAKSLKQGLTDIEVGAQFEPDFYGFHPYDWETASLLTDTTGRFLAGGPFYIPYTNGTYMEMNTFWGKPVVKTTAITYGAPICGAGKLGAAALIREGMKIEMTNSNEDDFKRNLICLRAEHRLALPVYRPVCFLQFTGFPARSA